VEALVRAVRPGRTEALDREVDQPRIDLAKRLVAEAESFESAERVVLAEDVDLLHQLAEDLAAVVALQIERDAALVRVEQQEVVRIDALLLGQQPPTLLAHLRRFDFDDVRAEPGEHLRARRAGFELRQVEDFHTRKGLFHGGSPYSDSYTAASNLRNRSTARRSKKGKICVMKAPA